MRFRKFTSAVIALGLAIFVAGNSSATSMLRMGLDDLTSRSATIFRGTVTDIRLGTIEAGGSELPTITYSFRIEDLLKGEATQTKGDLAMMEIRIIGSMKPAAADENGIIRFSKSGDIPQFSIGGDHVLFMTQPSSIGLSVTVGLGQGAFKVFPAEGEMQVVNEFNNVGLGLNGAGPVSYETLRERVLALLGQGE